MENMLVLMTVIIRNRRTCYRLETTLDAFYVLTESLDNTVSYSIINYTVHMMKLRLTKYLKKSPQVS